MNEHEWERLTNKENRRTERLKIEGGYLYTVCLYSAAKEENMLAMCFVPDSPIQKAMDVLPTFKLGDTVSADEHQMCTKEYVDRMVDMQVGINKNTCVKCLKDLSREEKEAVRNSDKFTPSWCFNCWMNDEGSL